MKKKITPSPLQYSVLAAAFLGVPAAEGQVIYHDIDPDITFNSSGDLFQLDIDGHTNWEFQLYLYHFSTSFSYGGSFISFKGNFLFGSPNAGNFIAATPGTYGYPYPFALNDGDVIDPKVGFLDSNSQSLIFSEKITTEGGSSTQLYNDGYWFGGQTDKYLGFRFNIQNEPHYGWLRMDVSSDNQSFTVKDFAFNLTPHEEILAGQTTGGTPVQNIDPPQGLVVFSHDNQVHIEMSQLQPGAAVRILDAVGNTVHQENLDQLSKIITLDITEGIYIVQINTGSESYSRKLFIK